MNGCKTTPSIIIPSYSKTLQVVKIKLEICYAGYYGKTFMHRGYISEILETTKILYGTNCVQGKIDMF